MGMEDETRDFLVRIANTVSIVLLWMMMNVFVGIYLGLGFFEGEPNWKNLTYYLFLTGSFVLLVIHLKKRWKL